MEDEARPTYSYVEEPLLGVTASGDKSSPSEEEEEEGVARSR